jgi:hypothetical protein
VSSDHDFLAIAEAWQAAGRHFVGVVFVHPLRVSSGGAVKELELIAKAGNPDDLVDRVEYLPLRLGAKSIGIPSIAAGRTHERVPGMQLSEFH